MITLPTTPNQANSSDITYQIVLEGQSYNIRFVWNIRQEYWFLTVIDSDGGRIDGVKMVPNWPLLDNHRAQIVLDGDLLVIPNTPEPEALGYDNLGIDWVFVYMTDAELLDWKVENGVR